MTKAEQRRFVTPHCPHCGQVWWKPGKPGCPINHDLKAAQIRGASKPDPAKRLGFKNTPRGF